MHKTITGAVILAAFFTTNLASACLHEPCSLTAENNHYYDDIIPWSSEAMRDSLHEIIDDHTRFPYTSSETDTWDVLEQADQDTANSNNIVTIYRNASYLKRGGGNDFYNREHTWPKSYGFPDNGAEPNYPYTDMHHLFLADGDYNFYRSNKPFANCDSGCLQYATQANEGRGGAGGAYPGDSNWTDGEYTNGRWEVWQDRRGDIARAMFYMDLRYEGGQHGVTDASEPDLVLTDSVALIASANSGENEQIAYMGMLATLLEWHQQDPVDEIELQHHEVVSAYQKNRNPFIDHPEWAACIFGTDCPVFRINAGLNDAWYNPETDGQGFFITVFPELGVVSLAWFTYDTERPADDAQSQLGEPGHRWLTALGPFEGTESVMNIDITSGGLFDTATDIDHTSPTGADGTITLTFENCNTGSIEYDIPSIEQHGIVPIQRIANDNATLCRKLSLHSE